MAILLRKIFYNENIDSLEDAREVLEKYISSNLKLHKNEVEYIIDVRKICKSIGKKKREELSYKKSKSKTMHDIYSDESSSDNDDLEDENKEDEYEGENADEDFSVAQSMDVDMVGGINERPNKPHGSIMQPNSSLIGSASKGNKQKEAEEKKKVSDYKTFIKHCKKIGRLGPLVTKLVESNHIGAHSLKGYLDIESKSSFASIRANTCVFKGKWYYEVKLLTGGLFQIGWCQWNTVFDMDNGVGDDDKSYAYDGKRLYKWNKNSARYGEAWGPGDIIGCYIDFDAREISFSRNGTNLGVAYKNIKTGPNCAYFPAVSLAFGERCVFNFGKKLFRNANVGFKPINDANCYIKGYYNPAVFLLESFKRFLMDSKAPEINISQDEKYLITSLIWEYFYPLMRDEYIMEKLIVSFFVELNIFTDFDFFEVTMDSLIVYLSTAQFTEWIHLFFRILSDSCINCTISKDEIYDGSQRYLFLVVKMLHYEDVLNAWVNSPTFYEDLENLFFTNLPRTSDIEKIFPKLYFQGNSLPPANKADFERDSDKLLRKHVENQKLMFGIIECFINQQKFAVIIEFVQYLVKKNIGYTKNIQTSNLSNRTVIINVFFCLIGYCNVLFDAPFESFPFEHLYKRGQNPNLDGLERIGGSLTHLEIILSDKIQGFLKQSNNNMSLNIIDSANLLTQLMILYSYCVSSTITTVIADIERLHIMNQEIDYLTYDGYKKRSKSYDEDISDKIKALIPNKVILLTPSNIKNLYKMAFWLVKLANYIDDRNPSMAYFIPDIYISPCYDVFRMFKRLKLSLYDSEEDKLDFLYSQLIQIPNFRHDSLSMNLITFTARHFHDKMIANPDFKESYLIRLNMFLQFDKYLRMMECNKEAQRLLIPGLIATFDKKFLQQVTRDFLRLSKGTGFNERSTYKELAECTFSQYFLDQLHAFSINEKEKFSEFINEFFNNLNIATTELTMSLKEFSSLTNSALIKQSYPKCRYLFNITIDLLRLLEMCTKQLPDLFLHNDSINIARTVDYYTFILNRIFYGSLDSMMKTLADFEDSTMNNLPSFLSPLVGISVNLHLAFHQNPLFNNGGYMSFEERLVESGGFEISVFDKIEGVYENDESTLSSQHDLNMLNVYKDFVKTMHQIIADREYEKAERNKHSWHVEESYDEDKICIICYHNQIDTKYIPCGHETCYKCISLHLLNSDKCPFCNAPIQETEKIVAIKKDHRNPRDPSPDL